MKILRIAVIGYYGRHNVGDDAMLWSILYGLNASFRQKNRKVEFYVITRGMPNIPTGISAHIIPFTPVKIFLSIYKSSIFVWGGGTFLHDFLSSHRYLKNLIYTLFISILVKIFFKKLWILGAGIGPINTWWGVILINLILRVSDRIVVRDMESIRQMEKIGISSHNVNKVGDLSMTLLNFYNKSKLSNYSFQFSREEKMRFIGISILPMKDIYFSGPETNTLIEILVSSFRRLNLEIVKYKKYNIKAIVLAFNSSKKSGDVEISQKINIKLSDFIESNLVIYSGDPIQWINLVDKCDMMISMRFHAIIYSFITQKPQIILAYHPKCNSIAEDLALPDNAVIDIRNLNDKILYERLKNMLISPHMYLSRFNVNSMKENIESLYKSIAFEFDRYIMKEGQNK